MAAVDVGDHDVPPVLPVRFRVRNRQALEGDWFCHPARTSGTHRSGYRKSLGERRSRRNSPSRCGRRRRMSRRPARRVQRAVGGAAREPIATIATATASSSRPMSIRTGTSRVPRRAGPVSAPGSHRSGTSQGRQWPGTRRSVERPTEHVVRGRAVRSIVEPRLDELVERLAGVPLPGHRTGPSASASARASASSVARICWMARWRRDRTVPTGQPSTSAASSGRRPT